MSYVYGLARLHPGVVGSDHRATARRRRGIEPVGNPARPVQLRIHENGAQDGRWDDCARRGAPRPLQGEGLRRPFNAHGLPRMCEIIQAARKNRLLDARSTAPMAQTHA